MSWTSRRTARWFFQKLILKLTTKLSVASSCWVLVDGMSQKRSWEGEFKGFLKICLKFLFEPEKLSDRANFSAGERRRNSSSRNFARGFIHKRFFKLDTSDTRMLMLGKLYKIRLWWVRVIDGLKMPNYSWMLEIAENFCLARYFFEIFRAQFRFWIVQREKFEIALNACNLFANLLK